MAGATHGKSREVVSIDRHLIDIVILVADLLGVLGLFYAAYDLFGRRHLKWLIRVLTPALVGAFLLVPAGIIVYAALGFTQLIGRGALIYGITGVLLGLFNGLFVNWPAIPEKPRVFSWRNAFAGFLLAFLGWSLASLSIEQNVVASLLESGVLALLGGSLGGVWSFLNWEPSPEREKMPHFSWRGGLLGVVLTYAAGFGADFALGYGVSSTSLFQGALLLPTGLILGALWPTGKQILIPLFSARSESGKHPVEVIEAPPTSTEHESAEAPSLKLRPPLFSWRGCLLGLVAAVLFGFLWAVMANLVFVIATSGNLSRQALAQSVGGALVGVALIGPCGAITGGLSRFIFWHAESLQDKQLAGVGVIVAALGALLQFVQPLLDYLNIPIR